MNATTRSRIIVAGMYGFAAAFLLIVLAVQTTFPYRWEWLVLGAAFGAFQSLAVEVNDRLRASPTVMIVMTAAVIFGRDSAAIGAATIVLFGAVTPLDVRERRWFQPVVNAGQLVLSAAVAGAGRGSS